MCASDRGWLHADPDQLDRFARELDNLTGVLAGIRTQLADMASFVSPSTDPLTMRAATELAEDGHDRPGTPVNAIATVIDDLRQQALTARLAALTYQDTEDAAETRMQDPEDQNP